MKTLKIGEDIVRKSDEDATKLVDSGCAKYCAKSLWKTQHPSKKVAVRVAVKEEVKANVEVKVKKGRGSAEAEAKYREKKANK